MVRRTRCWTTRRVIPTSIASTPSRGRRTWSYGGYMTSRTMFLGGGVFRAALAVAPVTEWRFYDTINTERYMRTPGENPAGSDEFHALTLAPSLKGWIP